MSDREPQNRYDDRNIDTLQRVYGEGYLSAGGDAEVARIVADVAPQGKRVLDIGCGLGGAAVTLARDHGAAMVQGVDIDAQVLRRAHALVNRADVADKVRLRQIDAGPLPFAPQSFDIVYANAVSCHVQDLPAFFRDIHRVLTEQGTLVGNEWFKASENDAYRAWDELLRERGLNFYFVTPEVFAESLRTVGFDEPVMLDRTPAFTDLARIALQRVDNELQQQLQDALGAAGYRAFREWTSVRYAALARGGMHQGHFRASHRPGP